MNITAATISITPTKKTTLGCNGSITTPYTAIDSDLEINAIRLIQDETNIFIITVDTLFVTNIMIDELISTLSPKYNLKKEQFMIIASHTHYAPFLDNHKPNLGTVDPDYYVFFMKKLVAIVKTLLNQIPQSVDIYYSDIETKDIMINRRKKAWLLRKKLLPWKTMSIYPNPNESIDNKLRLLQFCNPNTGKPLALSWNMACHPVMIHSPLHLSAHFPANIRSYLRQNHNDVPILFLQGFSGDIRPNNQPKPQSLIQKIETKINHQRPFQDFTKTSYQKWLKNLIAHFEKLSKKSSQKLNLTTIKTTSHNYQLDKIWDGPTSNQTLRFSAIYLDQKTVIIGVSAEVVAFYSLQIQKQFPELTIIPVGYMGSVFGYWPTLKMISEGGYEVKGFKHKFSLNGQFKKTVESCFSQAMKLILS